MTTDPAPAAPDLPEGVRLRHGQWYGALVIKWPAPRTPPVLPVFAEVSACELDADDGTERELPGVTRLTLDISPDGITADVETLVGHDGEPVGWPRVPDATPMLADDMLKRDENGEFATAVFRYMVAEMRLCGPWKRCQGQWSRQVAVLPPDD